MYRRDNVHRKYKSIATDHLGHVFGDRAEWYTVEYRLPSPTRVVDCRRADAIVHFRDRDDQLGNGLIIEVQYRNGSKDVMATTADYLAQDYAVAWLDSDDFDEQQKQCRLTEAGLRSRAKAAAAALRDELLDGIDADDDQPNPATYLLEPFDELAPGSVRVPAHPYPIARDRLASGRVCGDAEEHHDWIELDGRYWRQCRACGLCDVTLADIGADVDTPHAPPVT